MKPSNIAITWTLSMLTAFGAVVGSHTARAQDDIQSVGAEATPPTDDSAPQTFDQALTPYGEWIDSSQYGRVWRPSSSVVGDDFIPYQTGGHWTYTSYGWSWVSDWDWGWATFHYGRWFFDPDYGWVWLPDSVWGPGWVDWRFGDGYIGWAPMGPAWFNYGWYRPHWCFFEGEHFLDRDWWRHQVPPDRVAHVMSVTSVVTDRRQLRGAQWNGGPRPETIEQLTGHTVSTIPITPPRPGTLQRVAGISTTGVQPQRANNYGPRGGERPASTSARVPNAPPSASHAAPPATSHPAPSSSAAGHSSEGGGKR